MELGCVQRVLFPLCFGSYCMPVEASWLSLVSLLWTAGDKGRASEFVGQEWWGLQDLRIWVSWTFFLKMQINAKKKCILWLDLHLDGAFEVWLCG